MIKQNINTNQGREKYYDVRHEMIMHDKLIDNPHAPKLLGAYVEEVEGNQSITVVMEKVKGRDLSKLSFKREYFENSTPTERVKIGAHLIAGAVKALKPMHDLNITHLDVKPGNIMIDEETMEARLIDFGSAANPGVVSNYAHLATTSMYYWLVTGESNSPENAKQSDMYALGASLADLIVPYPSRLSEINLNMDTHGLFANKKWRSPTRGAKGGDLSPEWSRPELKDVRDAIELMCAKNGNDRPTMEQLYDAVEGREPRPVEPGQPGLKSAADVQTLLRAFDPNGPFGGGRDVLMETLPKI